MSEKNRSEYWDQNASAEEATLAGRSVNRDLRWREIERHLEGVRTILDIGGGTGAFSIPLARRGFSVTHVDIAPAMLKISRQKTEGVDTIQFVEADATDLTMFSDRSFDLVLNMDGPVSYSGAEADMVISESARVTSQFLILTVAHRAWAVARWMLASFRHTGKVIPAVNEILENGTWDASQFIDNALLAGEFPFPAIRTFLPAELAAILGGLGMDVVRVGALGSLSDLYGAAILDQVWDDDRIYQEYLDLCERFDLETLVQGPGSCNDTGLIAVARWPS